MKEYRPTPLFDLPRWLETITHFFFFLIFVIVFLKLGIRGLSSNFNFTDFVVSIILFMSYKLFGTYTAVDLITFDYENKQIQFVYWFYYFYKKRTTIKFEELDFKNRNDILLLGGSMGLYFYKNRRLKIKINRRNGWKDQQIDMLTEDLLAIKQPLRTLRKRRSIND